MSIIATPTLSPAEKRTAKRLRLLGAAVAGVGTITTVSVQNQWSWALIEDSAGREKHCFICDLRRDQITYPAEQQEYLQMTRRVGYGLFESVFQLKTVAFSDLTHISDEELDAEINRACDRAIALLERFDHDGDAVIAYLDGMAA